MYEGHEHYSLLSPFSCLHMKFETQSGKTTVARYTSLLTWYITISLVAHFVLNALCL